MSLIPSSESTSGQGAFLFIGQAGCQIGSALWMLYNAEHSVQADGVGLSGDGNKGEHICFYKDSMFFKEDEFHRGFCYHELEKSGKFVPRTLFVDLEPMVIDEIRTGANRKLFAEDWSFHEHSKVGDGSGIFSRAYNSIGRCIIGSIMDTVRHISEKSSRLNVFNIARSYGGATGSGLGSLILENIHDRYPKILIAEANVLNADYVTSPTVEPYNTLFGLESSCTSGGITFLYNNTALKNICCKNLRISQPHFYHLNQLMSHGISGIYASERFPGYGCCNLKTILTNVIPYPRIQLAVCSMAPIISKKVMRYEPSPRSTDMVHSLISNDHVMFDIDMTTGSFISCCVIYRGMVSPSCIAASSQEFVNEKKLKMVEWSPRGIKSGHSPLSITGLSTFDVGVSQLSMTMLSNHTNISEPLARECYAAHVMLKKKAFIHWYVDHGMEEEDFNSALENAMLLTLDYKEIDNSPDYALKLYSQTVEYEVDENGKKRRKKPVIAAEEGDMVYSTPGAITHQQDDLNKTGTMDNSKSYDVTTEKTDGVKMLENALKGGPGTSEQNAQVMNKILGDLTEKDRQQLIELAKANGIDASFLTNNNDPNFKVTFEMLQDLNNLIELAPSETLTITMTNKSARTAAILENALTNGEGNNKLNGDVMREVWSNLTIKDRKNLCNLAKEMGLDVSFLDHLDDPNFEVTFEMLKILNSLIELVPPDALNLTQTEQAERSMALLQDALTSGGGTNQENFDVMKGVCENMTEDERKNLFALAKENGIDASFLYGIEKDDFVVTVEMLENLKKVMELAPQKSTDMTFTNQTTKSMDLLNKALQGGESNDQLNREVMNELCGDMTPNDRRQILALAVENGLDASFLKACEDQNMEVTYDMLQTFNRIIELAPPESLAITMTSQSTFSMANKSTRSLALLQDAINSGEGNGKTNGNLMKNIVDNMTSKDLEALIALAKSKGMDISFFQNIENPDFEASVEMLQNFQTLLAETNIQPLDEQLLDTKPGSTSRKSKEERASVSIEPTAVELHNVRVHVPKICFAFTTKRTYEESYVKCITPRTTLTNIDYFFKLYSRAHSA